MPGSIKHGCRQARPEATTEAEDLYLLVLTGMKDNPRSDHPNTLAARTDLAIIRHLRSSAQLGDIEMYERETLAKAKRRSASNIH